MRNVARSLRARVTLGAVLVVGLALVVGAVAFDLALNRSLRGDAEHSAEIRAEVIAEQVEREGPQVVARLDDEVVRLVANDGSALVSSEEAEGETLPLREDPFETTVDDEPVLVVSEDLDDGRHVVLAHPLEVDREVSGAVKRLLLVATPVVLVLVGLTIWLVVGRALRPVTRIRREVDEIAADRLDRRVPEPSSGDEISLLASTMNRMLGRLDAAQQAQRRFVSDASHELRSPLATMRQHAELARAHPATTSTDELAGVVLDEGARLQGLVEAMLVLARLDEGAPRASESVDLDDLALAEVSRLRAAGHDVDGSAIGPGRVSGDARLLGQVVRNLADNAARHADGRIGLGVAQDGREVVLTVDDDGAGVPEAERERVLERFVRLDEARARESGGSGLGLAIVKAVVDAHGGRVVVETSRWGGARVVVTLPAAS